MPLIPSRSRYDFKCEQLSNCDVIDMRAASYCDVTLIYHSDTVSQWRCQPGRFSMAAHRHDRRGIYRCVFLRFLGRLEIDHSYGLRCHGLCSHSRHSTRGTGRRGRATVGLTRAVPGVAAQTTPAQTVWWSNPIAISSFWELSQLILTPDGKCAPHVLIRLTINENICSLNE